MGGQDDLFASGQQKPGFQQPVQFPRLVLILLAERRVGGLFVGNEVFERTVLFSVRRVQREWNRTCFQQLPDLTRFQAYLGRQLFPVGFAPQFSGHPFQHLLDFKKARHDVGRKADDP